MSNKKKAMRIVGLGIPAKVLTATFSACGAKLSSKVSLELETVQGIVNSNGSITQGLYVDGINLHVDESGMMNIVGESGKVELNPNLNRTYVINGKNYEVADKNIQLSGVKITDNIIVHEGITIMLGKIDNATFVNGIQVNASKVENKDRFVIGQHNTFTIDENGVINLATRNGANTLSAGKDGKLMIGTKSIEYIENDDKFTVCVDEVLRNGVITQLKFVIRTTKNNLAQMYINGRHIIVAPIIGAKPFERAMFIDGVEKKVGGIK